MQALEGDELNIISSTVDVEAAIRFVLGTRRHTRRLSESATSGCLYRGNFILKHQLYCIIENIAEVDESIEELCLRNVLRKFSHPSYPRDVILMFSDDYVYDVNVAFDALVGRSSSLRCEVSSASANSSRIVDNDDCTRFAPHAMNMLRSKFLHFIGECKQSTFSTEELHRSFDGYTDQVCFSDIASVPPTKKSRTSLIHSPTPREIDSGSGSRNVALFTSMHGLGLVDQLFKGKTQFILSKVALSMPASSAANTLCYFTHPMMGEFLKYVSDARVHLPRTIKRHLHHEVLESKLVRRLVVSVVTSNQSSSAARVPVKSGMIPCKASPFDWQYHIYDMLGNDTIYKTANQGGGGSFIKLK